MLRGWLWSIERRGAEDLLIFSSSKAVTKAEHSSFIVKALWEAISFAMSNQLDLRIVITAATVNNYAVFIVIIKMMVMDSVTETN